MDKSNVRYIRHLQLQILRSGTVNYTFRYTVGDLQRQQEYITLLVKNVYTFRFTFIQHLKIYQFYVKLIHTMGKDSTFSSLPLDSCILTTLMLCSSLNSKSKQFGHSSSSHISRSQAVSIFYKTSHSSVHFMLNTFQETTESK